MKFRLYGLGQARTKPMQVIEEMADTGELICIHGINVTDRCDKCPGEGIREVHLLLRVEYASRKSH